MSHLSDYPKPLDDFIAITGLKKGYAVSCFNRFGGYAPALASFAQSYGSLSDDYFEDKKRVEKNADIINKELKLIYQKARQIKARLGKEDKDVWAAYYASPSTPVTEQKPFSVNTVMSPKRMRSCLTSEDAKGSAPSALQSNPFKFAFGTNSQPSSSAKPFASGAFGAFAQPVEAAEKTTEKPSCVKKVKYCEPRHFTGAFLDMPLFWEEEVKKTCPLLNLNKGFIEKNQTELRKRIKNWTKKTSFFNKPLKYVEIEDEDEETVRVIIKDAERTFFHNDHRKKFIAFLCAMHQELKAYGQAMSYLAGLCMLALTEDETASVLRYVEKNYIPGHWAAEAVGFASSAWVVEWFIKKEFPDVAKHLEELKLWPDTYLQKILTGLCIHVLDFENLFEFLDCFMEGGLKYLIKFCLALVEHFRSDILSVKSSTEANNVYEIMRLDSKVADASDVVAILQRAQMFDLGEDGNNIDIKRSELYDKHVAPRLQRAPKTEAFEPCDICSKLKPIWWNDDVGAVCSKCKEEFPTLNFTKY